MLLSPSLSQRWITSPCRCTGRLLAPSCFECGVQTTIIDVCCPVYYCGGIDRWHSSAQGAASSRHHSSATANCYCNGIGVTIVTCTRVPAHVECYLLLRQASSSSGRTQHALHRCYRSWFLAPLFRVDFCCCDRLPAVLIVHSTRSTECY